MPSRDARQRYTLQLHGILILLIRRLKLLSKSSSLGDNLEIVRAERSNLKLGELASRNLLLKQNIELSGGAAPGLRQAEERPHKADQTERCPDKTSLALEVPGGGVENRRIQEVGADTSDVVAVASEDCTLDPKAGRRNLRDETISDGADGKIVGKHEDKEESGGRIAKSGRCVARNTQETHQHQHREHDTQTSDEQLSTTDPLHNEPRADGTAPADRVDTETKIKGLGIAEADLLEEVDNVTAVPDTTENLAHPDAADNFSASTIDSLKTVPVGHSFSGQLLVSVGNDHQCNGIFGVVIRDTRTRQRTE